jgi:hypothetical protein
MAKGVLFNRITTMKRSGGDVVKREKCKEEKNKGQISDFFIFCV